MCEYCENVKFNKPLICQNSIIVDKSEVVIEPPAMVLRVNGFGSGIKINYCPMCGRKLVDE